MFTSQLHIIIDDVILNIAALDIEANEEDIRKYVEGQIQESTRLSRHIQKSPTLWELIEDKIVKRSGGMSVFICLIRRVANFFPGFSWCLNLLRRISRNFLVSYKQTL
jgi:hypothetical protein